MCNTQLKDVNKKLFLWNTPPGPWPSPTTTLPLCSNADCLWETVPGLWNRGIASFVQFSFSHGCITTNQHLLRLLIVLNFILYLHFFENENAQFCCMQRSLFWRKHFCSNIFELVLILKCFQPSAKNLPLCWTTLNISCGKIWQQSCWLIPHLV